MEGAYRLKFLLTTVCSQDNSPQPVLSHVVTNPFTVYTAKKFPGMARKLGCLSGFLLLITTQLLLISLNHSRRKVSKYPSEMKSENEIRTEKKSLIDQP